MTQSDPINEVTKRAQRYWYEDGLWELGFGLVNLLLAGFYLLTASFNWSGPQSMILPVLQAFVLIGAFLVINKLVSYLKQRITYPRTGYVAYRKPSRGAHYKRAVLTGLLAAFLAVLVSLVSFVRSGESRTALVVSVVMAGMLVYIGYRFGLTRLYLVALLTLGLGYIVTIAPLSDMLEAAAFFGGLSLLILTSGLVTLIIYLRRTKPAGEEADYESPANAQQ